MNWLMIIILVILIWRIVDGYKKGMVKEIISFISMIVLCLTVALLGVAIIGYLDKDTVGMVVAVILLLALGIAHSLINLVLSPAKLVVKLPVVKSVDKLLGAVIGMAETIIMVWTLYILLLTVEMGTIGQQIFVYVQDSTILTLLYKYNYLAYGVSLVLDKFSMFPL